MVFCWDKAQKELRQVGSEDKNTALTMLMTIKQESLTPIVVFMFIECLLCAQYKGHKEAINELPDSKL